VRRGLGTVIALVLVAGLAVAMTRDGDDGGDAGELEEPVRSQVEWVLALVAGGEGADEVDQRFSAAFLRAVPASQVVALAERELRPMGPFTIARVVESTATSATIVLRGPGGSMRMDIAVAAEPPHRIEGLRFLPEAEAIASWGDLFDRLRAAAPDVGFLAAEVVDGECVPIEAVEPDRPLPIGSAFKLYVLGALAAAVDAGTATWDERVAIRDELRVHSSAHLADMPAGEERSLRDLARSMIAVSDNTATDHVMARVGRSAIEAALAPMGMAEPARNLPFPTTAELTRLKLLDDAGRTAWRDGSEVERRAILDALPATPVGDADLVGSGWVAPIDVDAIEWFASAADLCRAQATLAASSHGEVGEALAYEGAYDTDRWTRVSFKGGSEPGVLAASFLLVREDGRTFSLSALLMDTDGAVSPAVVAEVAGAFALLSEA